MQSFSLALQGPLVYRIETSVILNHVSWQLYSSYRVILLTKFVHCYCCVSPGLAGVYHVGDHYEFESGRGVEDISSMARAMYGPENFERFSPVFVVQNLPKDTRYVYEWIKPVSVFFASVMHGL